LPIGKDLEGEANLALHFDRDKRRIWTMHATVEKLNAALTNLIQLKKPNARRKMQVGVVRRESLVFIHGRLLSVLLALVSLRALLRSLGLYVLGHLTGRDVADAIRAQCRDCAMISARETPRSLAVVSMPDRMECPPNSAGSSPASSATLLMT
jgi:hypothetical protein